MELTNFSANCHRAIEHGLEVVLIDGPNRNRLARHPQVRPPQTYQGAGFL